MGFRYALRTLRRSPAFSATVVLTLALGIGASTAVFGALDRLLLRSLPYPDAGRLVALHESQTGRGFGPVSLPNLLDWRAQCSSFDGVAGFMTRTFGLSGGQGDRATPLTVILTGMVTSDLFAVLGGQPRLGRTFSPLEESQDAALLLLTDQLWTRQFQRAPAIVGRTVALNDRPYQVIGVLPHDFVFPAPGAPVDAYIPLSHRDYGARAAKPLEAVARLKPGVSLAAAETELHGVGARLAAAWPQDNPRGGAGLESLDQAWKGSLRRPLLLLTLAALLLLAIVCTNVVNLLLARSLARAREMEIRAALGARLADIVRPMLAEALLLCAAGGALALLLAATVSRALPLVIGSPAGGLSLDFRALAFAAAVSLAVTLLCALAPAFASRRRRVPFRLRQGLVVGQVALSLVLLLSAGAFLRVFLMLVNRSPGFDSSHVVYFGFGLPEGRYDPHQMVEFHRKLRQQLAAVPGVESAGAVWRLPLNHHPSATSFQFEDAGLPPAEWPRVAFNLVDPAYFPVMRIPLLSGRRLTWEADGPGRPLSLLVNLAFERAYGRGASLVDKRVQLRFWTELVPRDRLWQIAGVVADTYQTGLDQPVRPQIYLPVSQTGLDGGSYVLRTSRNDPGLAAAAAAAVRSLDPNLERIHVKRLDDWVSDSLGSRRLPAVLTGLFAAFGLALTLLGLYGAMALEIGQRRKEMAIRVALGAGRASIAALVLRRGLRLTLAGAALGALGFAWVAPAIASQLYQVSPGDPLSAGVVVALLFLCAAAACLRPAWDARRPAPIAILREM